MLFIPLPNIFGSVQLSITSFLFAKPVALLQNLLFDNSFPVTFSSDTRSLNILVFLLAVLTIIIALIMRGNTSKVIAFCRTAMLYYMAFILLNYGFDKIFLAQFYSPAPNILYTPFGYLSKDILYWSTMGVSPAYSVITGSIETIAALMLLFKRIRPLGLLLGIVVIVNIVVINFSFDISVKTFSLLLLAMAIYLSWPYLKKIYVVLMLNRVPDLDTSNDFKLPVHIKAGSKFFIVSIMLLQILYPYVAVKEPQPIIRGAYSVEKVVENGKSIDLKVFPVKRVFIHKNNYIIFQHHDETMKDYFFETDRENQLLTLHGYDGKKRLLEYSISADMLQLHFLDDVNVTISAKKLDYKELSALKNEFHFTIDALK